MGGKIGEEKDDWEKIGMCVPSITLPTLFIESIYFLHIVQYPVQQDTLSQLAQLDDTHPSPADFPTPN